MNRKQVYSMYHPWISPSIDNVRLVEMIREINDSIQVRIGFVQNNIFLRMNNTHSKLITFTRMNNKYPK